MFPALCGCAAGPLGPRSQSSSLLVRAAHRSLGSEPILTPWHATLVAGLVALGAGSLLLVPALTWLLVLVQRGDLAES
jgi:hypothetical protein